MVEALHPGPGARRHPGVPVVGGADREQRDDGQRVDRARPRGASADCGRRDRGQGDADDGGDDRRVEVDPTTGARLGVVRQGRSDSGHLLVDFTGRTADGAV